MMTKKYLPSFTIALWIASSLWVISGCGVYTNITVTSDSLTDFSKYKTFAWLPDDYDTANSPYNNEIIRSNLKNYFGQSFTERGYTLNLDTPDVLLQVIIVNKKREKEVIYPTRPKSYYYCSYYYCSPYYSPYPHEYYYRKPGTYCYAMGYCKEKHHYVEGSITLNVIDRKDRKLVWSGTAKGDIYDPAYINKDIHPSVLRILKDFPVKPLNYKKSNSNNDDTYTSKR